jgi:NADH:ubiquinone oxidoreductase subunit 3 (subunit A)
MSVHDLLLSPPVAAALFLSLAYGLYRLGGLLAAGGPDAPGKTQPYACGEDLMLPDAQLGYQAFFQLALMFGLLHLATLVISTLPGERPARTVALIYIVSIAVSVLVLTHEQRREA